MEAVVVALLLLRRLNVISKVVAVSFFCWWDTEVAAIFVQLSWL